MWIRESDIAHGWRNVKNFVGNAWHQGKHILTGLDNWANLGTRLLGAAAASGLKGKALEFGIQSADTYAKARAKAQRLGRDVETTVGRFRQAAPELGL